MDYFCSLQKIEVIKHLLAFLYDVSKLQILSSEPTAVE